MKVVRKVPIVAEPVAPKLDDAGNPIPVDPEAPVEEVEQKPKFKEVVLESTVTDNDDGTYKVEYTCEEEGDVHIRVDFLDDKGQMVPVRGSPYKASFVADAKPADNLMSGGCMARYIAKDLERIASELAEAKKEINSKDKDLKNVKVLLKVKENVERSQRDAELITLQIDQLDEALKLFQAKKLSKDTQIKGLAKLKKDWTDVKKITKEADKEIKPFVNQESDKNTSNIKKLEESITQFTADMKKREFFQYSCGTSKALEKLDGVFDELHEFETKISDFGENAEKFGKPEMIQKAVKDIDGIKVIIANMKALWDHIDKCAKQFNSF